MRSLELGTALGFSLLGAGMVVHSASMPRVAHIDYGPGLFPTVVGSLMIGMGIIAAARAALATPDTASADAAESPRRWDLAAIYVAMPIVFVVLTPILGFLLTMPLVIGIPAYFSSRRLLASLLLAVLLTLGLHVVFYELLRVALPWGVLTPWSGVLTWR